VSNCWWRWRSPEQCPERLGNQENTRSSCSTFGI